jgi:hypothetical protein
VIVDCDSSAGNSGSLTSEIMVSFASTGASTSLAGDSTLVSELLAAFGVFFVGSDFFSCFGVPFFLGLASLLFGAMAAFAISFVFSANVLSS